MVVTQIRRLLSSYSCSMSLGEILFPIKVTAGFVCVCYSSLMKGQVFAFSVQANFYFLT